MRAAHINSALVAETADLGSRGSRVIGETSGGRPICAGRASSNGCYAGFSARDHFEAAREHLGRAGILNHRARNNSARAPQADDEKKMAARARGHMAHYSGHIRRARALNQALPTHQRLEALT